MATKDTTTSAYIIAARRNALGRVGGLHRSRRLEDLAAPVMDAVLSDSGIGPDEVDEVVLGNTTAGANPARLLALAAGLPEHVPGLTIDRQCGSGLDAILSAIRMISAGEAQIVISGGAESLSTAPWRIAKPRNVYQLPHFIGMDPTAIEAPRSLEPAEALASARNISRQAQDALVLTGHLRAQQRQHSGGFVGEIVPLRVSANEVRDQSAVAPDITDLENEIPYFEPDGTLTPANTSHPHDGSALTIIVSEDVWRAKGRPPALRLFQSAVAGVSPSEEAQAPIAAMQKLANQLNGFDHQSVSSYEISESCSAQLLALIEVLELDEAKVNAAGGAVVRGHPLGAAGAVLLVRLFTELVRNRDSKRGNFGTVAQGTIGGLGLAAIFEAV